VVKAANLDLVNGTFQVWYSDEHALALGVGQGHRQDGWRHDHTNYSIAAQTRIPASPINPAVGTTATSGDQAGTDISGRPMAPSLFITDITSSPNSRSGGLAIRRHGACPRRRVRHLEVVHANGGLIPPPRRQSP